MTHFDEWYHERCGTDAAEVDGPNSPDYDATWDRFYEDDTRREVAKHRYHQETGRVAE